MRTSTVVLALCLAGAAPRAGKAQGAAAPSPLVPPFEGVLALAGSERIPDYARRCYLSLARGAATRLVVVATKGGKAAAETWRALGVRQVDELRATRAAVRKDKALAALLRADALWFADEAKGLWRDDVFAASLAALRRRGGVVGAAGSAAEALVEHFELLPRSVLRCGGGDPQKIPAGHVGWCLPKRSTLFFRVRRAGVCGPDPATAILPARGEWEERRVTIRRVDAFNYGAHVPRSVDLRALLRSALLREGPLFPPATSPEPVVPEGKLLLHGGGRVETSTFERFIEEAGGRDATIVCIPSGASFGAEEQPSSFSARKLRGLGCKRVFVLHTSDCRVADSDDALLAPLAEAGGVWIDGGRTYRLMDAYQHTRVHRMLRELLARGGIVAGSSAGCQVQGDFLVRGDPQSNKTQVFAGYETGFALLRGVILDVHLSKRKRAASLAELVAAHPAMLGIGVDENTALLVEGKTGTVIGKKRVTFFDAKAAASGVALDVGARYDLAARTRL